MALDLRVLVSQLIVGEVLVYMRSSRLVTAARNPILHIPQVPALWSSVWSPSAGSLCVRDTGATGILMA